MALSLRRRILWWSVASTLVIVLAAFLLIDGIVRRTIDRDQRETLSAGARLASQLQLNAVEDYVERTAALATAPTLRAAVETGDSATIGANLESLLTTTGVDWLAVTTPEGRPLAATDSAPPLNDLGPLIEGARYFDSAELRTRAGRLEQVHASGIFFGQTRLGVVLSGVAIRADRVAEMEAATQQRVAFVAGDDVVVADPTLGADELRDLAEAWSSRSGDANVREFRLGRERYLGSASDLPDGRNGVAGQLVTYRSLYGALAPARTIRYALLGIAGAGLLFAFAASFALAQRVTTPVNRLLEETRRLGSGDLSTPVETAHDDEIGRLAHGFETMRRSLASAQEELVRAERLSAVGRAASAIVHDIKQPVTVIQGHIELLRDDWEDEQARNDDLEVINQELGRLTGMMGEVLDFARGSESMHPSEGSVRELVESVARAVRPAARDRSVSVVLEHDYPGTWVLDFPRTRRVLENLVRNALGVLGAGGTVVLRSQVANGRLRFEVEDDGPGIPAEIGDTLFEPFVTHGKREGTGLGLAIVKAFVERQGGTVRFETSSAGTKFIVDLPPGGEA